MLAKRSGGDCFNPLTSVFILCDKQTVRALIEATVAVLIHVSVGIGKQARRSDPNLDLGFGDDCRSHFIIEAFEIVHPLTGVP